MSSRKECECDFIVDVPQLSANPLLQAHRGTCGKDPFSFSMFPLSFATFWPHLTGEGEARWLINATCQVHKNKHIS